MDVSPDGFAGWLEVIEERSGRRRWSDEDKARIASESYRPGLRRSVSPLHSIFAAIEQIAAHRDAGFAACSDTIRKARARTSGE